MIYILRTTVGRENPVIETMASRVKNLGVDVRAIVHPSELKGYIFIEGDINAIEQAIAGMPHVRGLIRRELKMPEITKFLETKKIEIKLYRGDIVEITGGPFKNEKGKITRVDEAKSEVTIELLDAAIPIPITVSSDSIKVLESSEKK